MPVFLDGFSPFQSSTRILKLDFLKNMSARLTMTTMKIRKAKTIPRAAYRKSAIATVFAHSLASMGRFGGVTDFFLRSLFECQNCVRAARCFSSLQTVMPEREEPHFHVNESQALDDRCLTLAIVGRITRAESCRCAGDQELRLACRAA